MCEHGSIDHLKICLMHEVIQTDDYSRFSWGRAFRRAWFYPKRRFNFWWRIANYLFLSKKAPKLANYINRKLRSKYGCDIDVGAKIKHGLSISHYVGLVIAYESIIGTNFHARQNTTIGILSSSQKGSICIGDNVTVGAHSCIIGDDIKIGNNVMIGAMCFINKNIPDNCIVYTPKKDNTVKHSEKNNRSIW
ncbi:serine acetyltransferase [Providencia sp. Je.9.19]|uniref:serine acetyltransferase n=1 Tax=Providencia sp. Je.9.19 TaxID=3142844 RepID=UPI003DA825C4